MKANNEKVAEHFGVKTCRVSRNPRNNRIAYIKCEFQEEVDEALKLHDAEMCGRKLRVSIRQKLSHAFNKLFKFFSDVVE